MVSLPCAAGVTEDPKRAPTVFLSNSCFCHQMFHPDAWSCFGQHLEQQKELEEERIYWVMHSLELEWVKLILNFSQGMFHPSFNLLALSLPSHPISHVQDGTRARIFLDGRHIEWPHAPCSTLLSDLGWSRFGNLSFLLSKGVSRQVSRLCSQEKNSTFFLTWKLGCFLSFTGFF